MAGEGRVVEGDLGVEADEPFASGPSAVGLAHDRQGVHLHEVGVVLHHDPDQAAARSPWPRRRCPPSPSAKRDLAGLEVEQAEMRVGVDPDDRLGLLRGHLLDLDAALRRAHHQDPLRRPVQHRAEVVLVGDVRGGRDEDLRRP